MLFCSRCSEEHEPRHIQGTCTNCGGVLLARYDLDKARATLTKPSLSSRAPSMWRYEELLPVFEHKNIVTLGEGYTPIIPLKESLTDGMPRAVWVKNEGHSPTGTFKARGMSVAVSKCKELAITKTAVPSIGNAALALAAYTARAGIEAHVFLPSNVSPAVARIAAYYGAVFHHVEGRLSDARAKMREFVMTDNAFDMSTTEEPYRVEGKKTMGLEMAEQLGWEFPDAIILPTGGGTGVLGIWKAVRELEELGLTDGKRPKLFSVQSTTCSPIVRALEDGRETAEPFSVTADSVAKGISAPKKPYSDYLILKYIRNSRGGGVAVSDEEILATLGTLAKSEGLFLAPEGAAAFAAMQKLVEEGKIDRDMKVVLLSTGHGFIYPELLTSPLTD
jgi:threonine synthase